jgi:predicted ATPase
MLQSLHLLRERIPNPAAYPFSVPAIQSLTTLRFTSRIAFFVGENGSGKSTLLEAIAGHIGFGREGGNRDMPHETTHSVHSIDPLIGALRLAWDKRTGEGFYFRAESLYSFASRIDDLDRDADPIGGYIRDSYGGKSLHEQSHGETFFTVLDHKFRRSGLFLLDEPEAALSPQRQLSFLIMLYQTMQDYRDAQFIISTHSPVLLGYPGAQIFCFDDGRIHEIEYEEAASVHIVRRFLNDREYFLKELFREEPTLFDSE